MSTPPPAWPPQPSSQPPYGSPPPAPVNATSILIIGILSFVCFGVILGPIAYIQGTNALKTLDTYGDPTNVRGQVNAGRICGLIGGILSVIAIIVRIGIFVAAQGHHV